MGHICTVGRCPKACVPEYSNNGKCFIYIKSTKMLCFTAEEAADMILRMPLPLDGSADPLGLENPVGEVAVSQYMVNLPEINWQVMN